jgi:two-component system alkaline phosphatase synthesis response regulator PhoP
METKGKKILIADDEPDILEIIQYNLAREGFQVSAAKDGDEALVKAKAEHPDLIILDIMMPKKNGVEVCQILRMQPAFKDTMIIFLTALNDEGSQIKGLETGADDYVTKPISPKVLVSRVNALFRRIIKEPGNKILRFDNLVIDPEKFEVIANGSPVVLAKKEFELLYTACRQTRTRIS